jgi:hypothetical protein
LHSSIHHNSIKPQPRKVLTQQAALAGAALTAAAAATGFYVAAEAYAPPEGLCGEDGEAVPAAGGAHRHACRQQEDMQGVAAVKRVRKEESERDYTWVHPNPDGVSHPHLKSSAEKMVRPFQQQEARTGMPAGSNTGML